MLFLLLVGYLIYKNSLIARAKGKSLFLWGTITFLAVFLGEVIGMFIVVSTAYPQYLGVSDINKSAELANAIGNNFLQSFFLIFCGFGGYLLIRFILERSKDLPNNKPADKDEY